MPETITLDAIEAKQAEVAAMIERFKQQAAAQSAVVIELPAASLALRTGERYAGLVLDESGRPEHHLILLPHKPGKRLKWREAMKWAQDLGATLPSRQEQALLFANCKPHLEAEWHWSSEPHGDDYAWYCHFDYGDQHYDDQDYEGLAVAVRRLNP